MMTTSLSLDLYLDYLLHKDELRNLFTLYYRRQVLVGSETRCFTPTPLRMGWIEVNHDDVEHMGFFDWVGVIVRCSLYLREDIPRRVVEFVKDGDVDEALLQQALDVELNEKAKGEALVYRDACQTRLLEWDRKSLADHLALLEADIPQRFEDIYPLLVQSAADETEEAEGEGEDGGHQGASSGGMPGVMMPMGFQGGNPVSDGGAEGEGDLPLVAGSFGETPSFDEAPDSVGEGQRDDAVPGSKAEMGPEESPGAEDKSDKECLSGLAHLSNEDALFLPEHQEDPDSALKAGSGFSLSGVGSSGLFVKKTDKPLEELIELVIKSATGDQGKEKGKDKMKWATHWSGYHRRFAHAQLMLGEDVVLPPKRKKRLPPRGKGKFKLQVYLDTSGSCAYYSKRFFSLVTNMAPDRFEITLCSFASWLMEHDIESKRFDYRSGGTNIREVLRHAVKHEAEKEMDAIVVLTDGDFSNISGDKRIVMPEKWHWVLTERGYKRNMPRDSWFYDLP